MKEGELLPLLNQIGNKGVQLGVFTDIDEVRKYISITGRFEKMDYISYDEYLPDFQFIYEICSRLQSTGKITLEEAYTTYDLILTLDTVSFTEQNDKKIGEDGVISVTDMA